MTARLAALAALVALVLVAGGCSDDDDPAGRPERSDPGAVELWQWDGEAWSEVEPAGDTDRHQDVWEWSGDPSATAVRVPGTG